MSATNSAPEVVKKEKAVVLTIAPSQLGSGMCVDGRARQGKVMNKPRKNSWSDREISIAEGGRIGRLEAVDLSCSSIL